MIKMQWRAAAFAAVLATPVINPVFNAASAQDYTGLYVFGDSLSDSGNAYALSGGTNPPSPPYFNGRVSNGPVWVESFAPALGLTYTQATNFAIAGAETGTAAPIDVLNQVNGFIGGGGMVPAGALTVVWAGNNDFLNNAATTPAQALTTQVVTNIGTAIGTLNAFGAETFLVPNLPKFGNTPGGAATGLGPSLNELAVFYNTNLHATMINLEADLGVRIFVMDIDGLFDDVLASPSTYGIANTDIPCLTPGGPTGACPTAAAADAALFWDPIHPTGAAHSVISQYAAATLAMFEQPRVVATSSYMTPIILDAQRQTTEQRLMTLRSSGANLERGPVNLYASYRMASGDRDDRTNIAGFEYDLDMVTIGADKAVGEGWTLGAAVTFGSGEIEVVGGVAETDVDTLMGSAYVSYYGNSGLYVDLAGALVANDFDMVRQTSFAFRPEATGEASGTGVYADLEVGYAFGGGSLKVGPFAGLRYQSSDIGSYQEAGAAMLNLTALDQRAGGLIGSVGLELGGALSGGDMKIVPIVRVAYETELDRMDLGASVQTSAGQIVAIGRGNDADDRITANAGLAVVGGRFSLSVSYQGTIDYSDGKDNGVVGRVSFAF